MITHAVSAQIAPGKELEAIEFTRDFSAHLKSKDLATPRAWQNQYGDQVDRILWTWEFNSLAVFEEWHTAALADEGVQQRLKAMVDIFVPGTTHVMALKEVV